MNLKNTNRNVILTKRIQERIQWDRRVSNSDIHVISSGGDVTLIGKVDSRSKIVAAVELAKSTKGVTSVRNQLEVPLSFARADSELRNLIENRIREMSLVGKEFISVVVERGCVKLEGVVQSKQKKALAAGFVWELSGVNDCHNLIKIDGEVKPFEFTPLPQNSFVLETNKHENLRRTILAL